MEQLSEKLINYVDDHQQELYDYLKKLISFDTTNFITTGNEMECQRFILDSFQKLGVQTEIYSIKDLPAVERHRDFMPGRDAENRPNVTACIPCDEKYRNHDTKRMMLSAHTDTMPAGDTSLWYHGPFNAAIKDGKMYGLGISDDKYGTACGYIIFKAIKDLELKLKNDLYYTAVSDEEYFGGNGSLLACLKYPCDLFVNLDGCDFNVNVAGLGGSCFDISVKYNGETSSAEPVIDALYKIRCELAAFGQSRKDELEADRLYRGSDHAKSAYRILEFGSGNFGTNVDIGKMRIVIYTKAKKEQMEEELNAIFNKQILPYLKEHDLYSEGFVRKTRFIEYAATNDDKDARRFAQLAEKFKGDKVKLDGAPLSDLDIYLRDGSGRSFNTGLLREFKHEGGAHKPNEFVWCKELVGITKALLLFIAEWCDIEG